MKKALATMLTLMLAVSLVACGNQNAVSEQPVSEPAPVVSDAPAASIIDAEIETTSSADDETEIQFQGYTEAERYAVYESEYQIAEEAAALGVYENLDARIDGEINGAAYTLYTEHDWATPKYHVDDYMMWRNKFHPEDPGLSDVELLTMFEDVYNECQNDPYSNLDWELICLGDTFSMTTGTPIPDNYIDQYKDWRNEKIPSAEANETTDRAEQVKDGTISTEDNPSIYYDEYDDQYRVADNPTQDVINTPSTNIDTPEGLPPAQVSDWDTDTSDLSAPDADNPNISAGITTIG